MITLRAITRRKAALLGLAIAACTPNPAEVPSAAEPRPTDRFRDQVDAATISGRAAAVVAGVVVTRTETLLDLDFENGLPNTLRPFSSNPAAATALRAVAVVAQDPDSSDHSLRIGGGVSGGASLQTAPIPIEGGASFFLRWSVRTEDLEAKPKRGQRTASVEPLFFALGEFRRQPQRDLAHPLLRRKARRSASDGKGPDHRGDTAWTTHERSFTAPADSNFLVLSLDHTRTADDRDPATETRGTVWFDDILLKTTTAPLHQIYGEAPKLGTDHPLRIRAELPARDAGSEIRDALFAPAPSTLSFQRRIPPRAVLSLSTGILPEGGSAPGGSVSFEVRIVDGFGVRKSLETWTHEPGDRSTDRGWVNRRIDLHDLAGQDVTIELATRSAGAEGSMPGGAAAWGDPVLSQEEAAGRLVVIAVIDTASVNHLSAYGYSRATSPFLERLGRKGAVILHARASAPWTLPSFASLWTGLDSVRHGGGDLRWGKAVHRRPLDGRFPTLAERLRDEGFETAAFVNNPFLTASFGLDRGFTTWRDYGLRSRSGAGKTGVDLALRWLADRRGNARFLVVHLMDSHTPYNPPWRYTHTFAPWFSRGRFRSGITTPEIQRLVTGEALTLDSTSRQHIVNLYDGALRFVDDQLARLYEGSRAAAGPGGLTFLVTADHGEELWEHGGYEHGHQLYDEVLAVPFVLESPGVFPGGQRLADPVCLTDVAPTILDILGLPPLAEIDGISLLPRLLDGGAAGAARGPVFARSLLYGPERMMVLDGDLKYVYSMKNSDRVRPRATPAPRHQLFDLKVDPQERQDLSARSPETTTRLHAALEAHVWAGLADRDLIGLDGGGDTHTWTGDLKLKKGERWAPLYEDVVAPLPDGGAGALTVKIHGATLSFEVTAPRALLAFRRVGEGAHGEVETTLRMDGVPWLGGIHNGGTTTRCLDSRPPGSGGSSSCSHLVPKWSWNLRPTVPPLSGGVDCEAHGEAGPWEDGLRFVQGGAEPLQEPGPGGCRLCGEGDPEFPVSDRDAATAA